VARAKRGERIAQRSACSKVGRIFKSAALESASRGYQARMIVRQLECFSIQVTWKALYILSSGRIF
jgi:hypothetical protein